MDTQTLKRHNNEVVEMAVYEGLQMEESDFCCDGIFIYGPVKMEQMCHCALGLC
jgi:hypothetical protein